MGYVGRTRGKKQWLQVVCLEENIFLSSLFLRRDGATFTYIVNYASRCFESTVVNNAFYLDFLVLSFRPDTFALSLRCLVKLSVGQRSLLYQRCLLLLYLGRWCNMGCPSVIFL